MPESTKALRRRIRSIKNTRQITRAMEMVSASKLKRTENALNAARPYNERLQAMLRRLVLTGNTPPNVLFEERETVKARLLVVFAADRGLCGAYNAYILKAAENYIRRCEKEGIGLRVLPVGRRAVEFFVKKKPGLARVHTVPGHGGKPDLELAREIADRAIEDFSAGNCDEVVFLFNRFISTVKYTTSFEKFLPFDRDALAGGDEDEAEQIAAVDYIYEPGADRVFEELLPRFIQSKVYVAMTSAMTSEHSARMVAMNNATKNCGELIEDLTLAMNKARQAAITKEILEIVGGAEAIQQ